jgi:short-subunit dehydrogenase
MKVTLITGASSGMGHLLAQKALADGHTVIVNARRREPLEYLKKMEPERVAIVAGDLREQTVRDSLIKEVERLGHLDYLFNNAGFGWYGYLEKETNVDEMVGLNVTALIEMTRLCIPYLKKAERGRILNIASALGLIEIPFMSVYVATKFAVVGFTRALNMELAQTNITATVFCPSGVKTEFARVASGRAGARETDKYAESADKVVAGIWRKKDSLHDLVYPTFLPWLTVFLTKLLRPFIVSVMKNIVRKKGLVVLDK